MMFIAFTYYEPSFSLGNINEIFENFAEMHLN